MEMMNGFASCLIKVRQHYIGFPSLFSHYPEGMKHEELTEIHEYVQNAMDQPREIPESSGYLRRVIIGTGKYLIMGVSGYAQHLAAEVQNIPNQLVDFTGRGCPGFIGFVWNLDTTPVQQIAFPSLSDFGSVFQELILEHWEDSKNSAWAYETRTGVEVTYKYSVSAEPLPVPVETVGLNHNKKKLYSFDKGKEKVILYQALSEAIKKQTVSVCTDLFFNDEEGSNFLNMTANLKGGSMVSLENARFTTAKPINKQTPVVKPDQSCTPVDADRKFVVAPGMETFEDNNLNGGFETSNKGIFPPKEEPRSVLLKFKYEPCDVAEKLRTQFIDQLVATYHNYGQEISPEVIIDQPSKYLVIYVLKFYFPTPILLEDFMKVCEGILRYFTNQKWVYRKANGQCFIKDLNEWKEFSVSVAYKNIPRTPKLISGEEILLLDFNPDAKKHTQTKTRSSPKTETENPNMDPQISTSSGPLILQIKQNNSGQQTKKRGGDDDPFKFD